MNLMSETETDKNADTKSEFSSRKVLIISLEGIILKRNEFYRSIMISIHFLEDEKNSFMSTNN